MKTSRPVCVVVSLLMAGLATHVLSAKEGLLAPFLGPPQFEQ